MSNEHLRELIKPEQDGHVMHELMTELYPICRSISGEGFLQTLNAIAERIPLNIVELKTGEQVFDWTVPKEWNIRDAWIKNSAGEKVVDFKKSTLHIVSYSLPTQKKMSLKELEPHLFSLPELPDFIPYRTSYYKDFWGFCMAHKDREKLSQDTYEVHVDSTLEDGVLRYGECVIKGETDEEIILSAHACHPSTCNDNLSGVVLLTKLGELLKARKNRYTYRLLFVPGGIGSLAWLRNNEAGLHKVKHGLVLTCVGDAGNFTYKLSRHETAEVDRAALLSLEQSGKEFTVIPFSPYGYDERNYSSPAFNLPVGSLTRSTHTKYEGYHSSGDDLQLVQPQYLADSLTQYVSLLEILESNRTYDSLNPKGEPRLGKRGLYGSMGGLQDRAESEVAMLWMMNYSDGKHDLIDIAERSKLSFTAVANAAQRLHDAQLLKETPKTPAT